MRSIVDYVMIFKGRGLKMGVFVGGGGGGVDLDLDFKNFWDGVYNFFFCPPLACFISFFLCRSSTSLYTNSNKYK